MTTQKKSMWKALEFNTIHCGKNQPNIFTCTICTRIKKYIQIRTCHCNLYLVSHFLQTFAQIYTFGTTKFQSSLFSQEFLIIRLKWKMQGFGKHGWPRPTPCSRVECGPALSSGQALACGHTRTLSGPRAHGPGGRQGERLLFSRRVAPPPGGVSERLSYHALMPEEGSSAHVACAASSLDVGKGKRCVRGDWAPRQDVARPAAPEGRPAGPRAQMQPRGPDGARSSA